MISPRKWRRALASLTPCSVCYELRRAENFLPKLDLAYPDGHPGQRLASSAPRTQRSAVVTSGGASTLHYPLAHRCWCHLVRCWRLVASDYCAHLKPHKCPSFCAGAAPSQQVLRCTCCRRHHEVSVAAAEVASSDLRKVKKSASQTPGIRQAFNMKR